MSLEYLFSPTKQFTYPSGKLLDGGKIFVYFKDTTDLVTLYSPDGSFVSNPILLDANGRASVRADIAYQYRLEIYTNDNVLLYTCEAFCEGDGSGGFSFVIHDETLSGNGTASSPLGVINIPLAVEDSLTAYEDIVEGKNALVLGVNSAWLDGKLDQELAGKVDRTEFEDCCSAVNAALDNKLDSSAYDLSNYYNKQETNNLLDQRVDRYEFAQTMNWVDQTKQDKLEFGYDENSAISSINNSALAGGEGGDSCPWISGSKVIADTQTLTSNMIIQVLSSFDLSGYKNHNIGLKGGTYRFPNEYEIGSALLHTNYFMHLSGMSAYLPLSAFSSYTASIANNLQYNWDYTNSAYTLSLNNFYNKLDVSAFSSYSAGQESTINNITEQITNISNVSGNWNDISAYQQNSANYLTGINIQESASWNEATNVVQTNSSNWNNKLDLTAFENASGNFYPMTGNPSGFLTGVDISNYYKKNETSSKGEIDNALTNKLNTTAFTAWSSTIFSGDYELSAGNGIALVDDVQHKVTRIDFTGTSGPDLSAGEGIGISTIDGKTVITNSISAGSNISLVYDVETNKIRIDGEGGGKTYTGVAPIQVNNSTNQISITGESLSAGPGIDLFESGGYVVISANGGVGAGGTSAYYTTGGTSIFEDTMNINSDGVVTLGSYTPGQLVPTTNLTSDEGKFPMIYCRDGRSYYLLERVRQLPYYNAQTNGVLGMSAGSPDWVPMPNCYCVKLNNVTTSVDLANYTAYDKVTVVHSQEGGNDCHLYWDGKTKVIHSASYCELVKVTDGNNNIKWTFTTSGWTNDNWWDWD